jgi:hypothetical protein
MLFIKNIPSSKISLLNFVPFYIFKGVNNKNIKILKYKNIIIYIFIIINEQ